MVWSSAVGGRSKCQSTSAALARDDEIWTHSSHTRAIAILCIDGAFIKGNQGRASDLGAQPTPF
jgi:hypothetical protein